VAINSASVPVLYTDSTQQNILASGKIDSQIVANHAKLAAKLQSMKQSSPPIEINLGSGIKNYIFYEESYTLKQLRYYPYIQLLIIMFFLLIAYTLFSTARNSEQNLLFVGMSKETAHQLGTPLSSLMAWIEYLKETTLDPSIVHEMNRDVVRLQTITDRFSKIGSQPTLTTENVFTTLEHALDYLKQRSSKNINFVLKREGTLASTDALICVPLFEWVVENICKNAIDAMDGKGTIMVTIQNQNHKLLIDITDTGKGIAKNKLKAVFEPGYTTKQRGWGMGLSLCRRIIENYHNGKVFVKQSETGKGTTFRVILGI
jgi:signal transduction histidine kinase